MALTENIRLKWERITPRERLLVILLAVSAVVILVFGLGRMAQKKMEALESKNNETRLALKSLSKHQANKRSGKSSQSIVIPDKPISLDSYLDPIISKAGIDSPMYPSTKTTEKKGFNEVTIKISLKKLTLGQTKEVLENIEKSKMVIVKELNLDKNFREKEKLDVELTVATYSKVVNNEEAKEEEQ